MAAAVPIPAVVVGRITQQTLRESKLVKRRRSGYEGVRPDVSRSSIIGYRGRMTRLQNCAVQRTTFDFAELYRAYVPATPLQQPKTKIEMIHAETRDNSGFPGASAEVRRSNKRSLVIDKPTCLYRALKRRKDEGRFSFMNLRSSSHEHL